MPDLVALVDQKAFMGVTGSADDALLTALLEHAEGLFEAQCGRRDAPFRASQGSFTEVHRGTGTGKLWLNYPVNTVTAVKIGRDPSAPEEELDVVDPTILYFEAGKRLIERTDDGTFGGMDVPACVRVTYSSADDLPEDAKLAIKRAVAAVYGQRGSEDAVSESDAGFSHTLAKLDTDFPEWAAAVAAHKRTSFR